MDKQQAADFARWERVTVGGDNRRCHDLVGPSGVACFRSRYGGGAAGGNAARDP
ncbi:hypothetical protein Enr8_15330 [Blastopirellula retiformator]|uniref:Uncharacterized protein n=1 Tax=Blastopirellula retiformator TaxID=2527970 RepID=A0A5C5V7T9_9BACT|nr:hypothetical protein Enr8_15330 [Blastopirellula retiformator]